MTDASATAVRDARLAWIIGGSLLIAHSVLRLIGNAPGVGPIPTLGVILDVLWAGALLVFALGIRRSGSVVARQPVGVIALIVAAAMPFVSRAVWWLLPLEPTDRWLSVMVGEGLRVVTLAALLAATVSIARAGVVPRRARWAPLVVLAVVAGIQVLISVIAVAAPQVFQYALFQWALFASGPAAALGGLLLGILAVFFAPREVAEPTDRTVPVYGPPPST